MESSKQKFILADWKFANPKVDYAFKRIFGTEKYKDATINLLNSLLPHLHIMDVEYPNTELIGDTGDSRKACIDVLCTDNVGRQFIIEMQNAEQEHFFERAVFYSSRLISMAAPKGTIWNYALPPTYVIAFLDFPFSAVTGSAKDDKSFIKHYRTCEPGGGEKMPGSTEFIFFSLRNFDKKEAELETYPEKWLFLLKHSESFNEVPKTFKSDKTFDTFFEGAVRAGYSKEEEEQYVSAMMNQWDIENAKNFACARAEAKGKAEGMEKGRAEGRAEGKAERSIEIAQTMKSLGIDINTIIKSTGLSEIEVKAL